MAQLIEGATPPAKIDKHEVVRRLRAYKELPPEKRPLTWKRLAEACGEQATTMYGYVIGRRILGERVARKIAAVLKLIEEGRIAFICDVNTHGKGRLVVADDVPAPLAIRRVVMMTREGPRLANELVNPMSFPPAPPLFRKLER